MPLTEIEVTLSGFVLGNPLIPWNISTPLFPVSETARSTDERILTPAVIDRYFHNVRFSLHDTEPYRPQTLHHHVSV